MHPLQRILEMSPQWSQKIALYQAMKSFMRRQKISSQQRYGFCCEAKIELAVKLGVSFFDFSLKENIWLIVCFTGSVEFKSQSYSLGMDKSSAYLRIVFCKCRQVKHRSHCLKCYLRIRLFRASIKISTTTIKFQSYDIIFIF